MPDMLVPQTSLSLVKNSKLSIASRTIKGGSYRYKPRVIGGFSHMEGWQSIVQRELERHGIHADS